MGKLNAIEPDTQSGNAVVELRVSADPTQLSVVRAVAGTIAGQDDFDLDAIADVRLAMDEACSFLIVRAKPDSILTCSFQHSPDHLRVRISTRTVDGEATTSRTFGWYVLETLTDSIALERDGDVTAIEFTKSKVGPDA
ncbi:ATP-binding protein [Antrihabitans stalactiti]|uniref:ATP-binding protein n=1 Tax=Antrihabitans stalactiti TaxID=2584121 RepID=A0A848KIP6_9NOCA|nr:ATP-binding protein [Antrihabitans stalactiti]NMN98021.1 ATP-binding protein [Antrihabitans stalactiti]